jgi:hypothetical protein
MLRPATHIRYHITAILAVHWLQFVAQYKRWIRPSGLGYWNTGMMQILDNRDDISFLPTMPEFQHSTKIATDVWANQVLTALLDLPYHHLIMAIPWQLRIVIIMNRRAGLNLLVHAATESIQQWARDIKGMRMGILIVLHPFFCGDAQQALVINLVCRYRCLACRSAFQYSIHW